MECAPTSCVHKCTHHRRSRSCHLAGTAMDTGSRASRIMRPIWSWGNGDHLSSELYLVDAVQIRCYLPHKKHDCHLISHQLRGSKNPLFLGGMTERATPEKTPVGLVIAQWKSLPTLVEHAAGGIMCKIGRIWTAVRFAKMRQFLNR